MVKDQSLETLIFEEIRSENANCSISTYNCMNNNPLESNISTIMDVVETHIFRDGCNNLQTTGRVLSAISTLPDFQPPSNGEQCFGHYKTFSLYEIANETRYQYIKLKNNSNVVRLVVFLEK